MPFEKLFIRTRRKIGGVELDGVISESHDNRVRLTSNPVEFGADITDHAFIEPKRVSVVAIITDTPLGTAAFGEIINNVTNNFGTSTVENITRSESGYKDLVRFQESREKTTLQTGLVDYVDMVITDISVFQDKDSSRAVNLRIGLQQVLLVETEIVPLTVEQLEAGRVTEQAQTALSQGRQEVKEVSEDVNRSVLKSVTDWIGITE